jgi:DNA mismatch endonuclease (patch repair protein)
MRVVSERTDVLTEEQRRFCMARNTRRDTRPELLLRKACWSAGLRYRLGSKIFGSPDFIFPAHRVAVFVDGCFWHGCPQHYKAPVTHADYWRNKLHANRQRDGVVTRRLEAEGWTVVRIWEHTVRSNPLDAVEQVLESLISCDSQKA